VRRAAAIAVALLLACAAALVWRAPAERARRPPRTAAAAMDRGSAPPSAPPRPWRAADTPRRPRSLAGTRPDGGLDVDPRGRLRPSATTRRLFDYFLSATGEEPVERIRARIVALIERRLAPTAVSDATALLDRYLAYRESARDLAAHGLDAAPLEERLEAVVRLRREVLGSADAEALFGEEEARDRAALASQRALADPALSPDERARALAEARAALPAPIRDAEATATLPMRLATEEAALRAGGGSDADVQRLREESVGPEAAARLAALDRERAAWQSRLDAYRAERATIDADASRSDAERERARAALLAARFAPAERPRVEALDEIAGR
jgi:lipase chaperone LimK